MSSTVLHLVKQRAHEEVTNAFRVSEGYDEPEGDSIMKVNISNNMVTLLKASTFHDRQNGVMRFLDEVCKSFPKQINCTFSIGLHDQYSSSVKFKNLLVFSKSKNAHHQIMIPDFYAMGNYNNSLLVPDKQPYSQKEHRAVFAGCTTGDTDPQKNRRLTFCHWAWTQNLVKGYISTIVQMDEADVASAYPSYKNYYLAGIYPVNEQRKHKFIVTMDGNTAAWDRFPWIMNSQSVCLKENTDNLCWYYPLTQDGRHFLGWDDFEDIPKLMESTSEEQAMQIIENANQFTHTFLTHDAHKMYMGYVLYYISTTCG
jgi:hypothetical protein